MKKAAIVGAGWAGNIHGKILATELKDTKLAAVVETNEKKGIDFSKKYNANFYLDFDEMLKKEDVDLVVICTPTPVHAEYSIKAANAKKIVFCEKPMAMTLKEADRMIEAIKRNNVKCMIGHVLRFWPEYVKIKQIVESGALGKPLHGVSERLLSTPTWTEDNWYVKEKLGGGAALDVQIHDIDFLIWIFGNARVIKSQGVYDEAYGGWSHIATNIEFEGGGSGFVQAGIRYQKTFPFTMLVRIVCEKGTVEWTFRAGVHLEERGKQIPVIVYKQDGKDAVEVMQDDPYLAEWKYFMERLAGNKDVDSASPDDGRRALKVALASIKSAERKTAVKV